MKNKKFIHLLAIIGLSFFVSNLFSQVYSINTVFTGSHLPQKISAAKTTNGKTWKVVCDSLPISPRMTYGTAWFKNKLWLFGGVGVDTSYTYDSVFTDIYSSSNGKKWQKVSSTTPFEANPGSFNAFVTNDTLFVISDTLGGSYSSEHHMWFTTDGKNWKYLCKLPITTYNSGVRFFDGKVYKIGGLDHFTKNYSNTVLFGMSNSWNVDTTASLLESNHYGCYVFNGELYAYANYEVWKLSGGKWKNIGYSNDIYDSPLWEENYHFIEVAPKKTSSSSFSSSAMMLHESTPNLGKVIDTSLIIYPNPATEAVNIECSLQTGTAQLYDLNGRLLQSVPIENGSATILRENLPLGIYVAKVGAVTTKFIFQ